MAQHAAAQYVLLFLVQFNNSDRFQIYEVTRSYSTRLFLFTLHGRHCPLEIND